MFCGGSSLECDVLTVSTQPIDTFDASVPDDGYPPVTGFRWVVVCMQAAHLESAVFPGA